MLKNAYKVVLLTVAISTASFSSASAYNVTFNSTIKDAQGNLTTNQANTVVWNFASGDLSNPFPSLINSISEHNASVVSGSIGGQWAEPGLTDGTPYLEVGANGHLEVQLNGAFTYFGLYWGSIDSYNTLTFYNNGIQVAAFSGSAITTLENASANGNQSSGLTNIYVNFNDLPAFNSFELTSGSPAFEVDNIAFDPPSSVPEPAAMFLFGTGLVGLAGLILRKKS